MCRSARPAAVAAALALGTAAALAVPGVAHAATATYLVESEWAGGQLAKITVHNDGSRTLTGWRVEFDLPAGTSVSHHWNAELTRSGSRYAFTNLSWNGTLAPGASTSFGWLAAGTGAPASCTLNGALCAGAPTGADLRPPTVPGNPRSAFAPQTYTLLWDASTDDHGVVGYEVFANGRLIATTTETSHTMPIPPPMVFTFGIRALDAAGNSSAFAIVKLGELPDSQPPTAPSNLRLTGLGEEGHFRLTWDASQDNVFVAGYEVTRVGVPGVTLVGDTFALAPYEGFGTYVFRVRAFDSSGTFSEPAQIGIAVDPPPPPTP